MINLAKEIISIIEPKCFKCGNTATRMITYDLCLGESYCCDNCGEMYMSGKRPHYKDLDCAEGIRKINNNKEIDLSIIFKLLYCVYPKCNVCNKTATKLGRNKILLTIDWLNFCDSHTHLDLPTYKNMTFAYEDFAYANIVRKTEKYLEDKLNES